ncbi:MAG: PilZ domain-containing protein [Candidatus Omnitrophota bacterium]
MVDGKRKFLRFDVTLGVEVKPSRHECEYALGVTKDFSREGLSFVSQHLDSNPEDVVDLKLKLPQTGTMTFVSGNVVWKKKEGDKCRVGIKFNDINSIAKTEILDSAYDDWLKRKRAENFA